MGLAGSDPPGTTRAAPMWHRHAQQRVPGGACLSCIRRILALRARPVRRSRHGSVRQSSEVQCQDARQDSRPWLRVPCGASLLLKAASLTSNACLHATSEIWGGTMNTSRGCCMAMSCAVDCLYCAGQGTLLETCTCPEYSARSSSRAPQTAHSTEGVRHVPLYSWVARHAAPRGRRLAGG